MNNQKRNSKLQAYFAFSILKFLLTLIISNFQKYFLTALVAVYTIAAAGIPVYLHYCGGELEEVNYITSSNDCCGDEEPVNDDCCKNEGLVLKCNPDVTIQKQVTKLAPVPVQDLFSCFHFSFRLPVPQDSAAQESIAHSPPETQSAIIDSTVLRI